LPDTIQVSTPGGGDVRRGAPARDPATGANARGATDGAHATPTTTETPRLLTIVNK